MNILVTGGLGFLGINLLQKLAAQGDSITCIDHLGSANNNNILVAKKLGIKIVNKDINQPFGILEPIDQIYHLASRASPENYQRHPVETALTGSVGTNNLLKLCQEKNARLLFTSSSEIYGDPLETPQHELYWGNVNPIGVRSCYDESKRFSEALIMAYHREYRLDVKIVRVFNSYGPGIRIDDGRIIPNFVTQALRDKPLTVYGDGSQTRSFCYVTDMIEGIWKMMNTESFIGPVNIGNPHEQTVLQIAKLVINLCGSRSKIIYKKLPSDDPLRRRPDISLAKNRLKWEPGITIEEGLKFTIAYFKKYMTITEGINN